MDFDLALTLFWLKKLISALILPPALPLLLTVAGLLFIGRRPRLGRVLAWGGVALTLLLTTPVGVAWMLRGLEPAEALAPGAAAEAGAIVIVGAGRRGYAPEFGGETVNRLALERLRYGARLARETGLPILVSGGAPTGDVPEAELMRETLETDFAVPVRWLESASLDTRDNARFSAATLKAAGIDTVLLVTHAAHMKRTREAFELAGLRVVPAPTGWLGGGGRHTDGADEQPAWMLLPNQSAAYAGWYAMHEWVGLLAYRLSR